MLASQTLHGQSQPQPQPQPQSQSPSQSQSQSQPQPQSQSQSQSQPQRRPRPQPTVRACPFELPQEGVDLGAVECGLIEQALQRAGWNQTKAAKLLGISRFALRHRIDRYGLAPGGQGT